MASLQLRNGSWRILFNFKGKQLTFTVGEVDEIEARAVKGRSSTCCSGLSSALPTPSRPTTASSSTSRTTARRPTRAFLPKPYRRRSRLRFGPCATNT